MLKVHVVSCLTDNYAYLIEDTQTKHAWVIDPSEAGPVQFALKERGLTLTQILNTHHHWDHVGGNLALKAQTGAPITCSSYDQARIEGADTAVVDHQILHFGESAVRVIEIPGHTLGHIAFYFEKEGFLFTGDTLFVGGCGRLFEGTPEQMYTSLKKLAQLPDSTTVYCGHEYTEANLKFARTIEATNEDLKHYSSHVGDVRKRNQPSVPSTIGIEKKINVFVRAPDTKAFARLRALKDSF
jgi:hydroxyacylglutathione hydrolase